MNMRHLKMHSGTYATLLKMCTTIRGCIQLSITDLRFSSKWRFPYIPLLNYWSINRDAVDQPLDSACIKLVSVMSDNFDKSGMFRLNCVVEGREIIDIIDGIPSGRLKKMADQIKASIKSRLDV